MTSFDLDWVTPQLAVGGRFPMEEAARMVLEEGVTRVVDLRSECCDDEQVLRRHGIVLLKLPTEDRCAVSQHALDHGAAWIASHLQRGEKVFVHCEYGIGRSALLALCVLTATGLDPLEALRALKSARSKVSPSPEQLEAFRAWVERHGGVAPEQKALFEVAYANLREGSIGTGSAAE